MGILQKIKALTSPPTHSVNVSDKIKRLLSEFGPDAKILDLGSGPRKLARYVVNVDMKCYDQINVIADGNALPFKPESFDVVIVQAMLEHTPNPSNVVNEIQRILKEDGCVYAEVPFIYPYHPAPEDYYRFTLKGTQYLFRDFEHLDSGVCVGPTSALWAILKEYIPLLLPIPIIRGILYRIIGWIAIPFSYLDVLITKTKRAQIIASGIYFYGKKNTSLNKTAELNKNNEA